jgi:hypothetical protein
MLTIIILTAIAIIMLCIGFFDVRLPFINSENSFIDKNKKLEKEPAKAIESFYRTLKVESWLNNIQRSTSDVA